jgi:hypothetical protein
MVTNPWINRITVLVVLLAIYAAGYAGGRDQAAATMALLNHPACHRQPQAMTTKMRRFYFQIPAANVIECIWAHSLTDAKAKAALEWMPWWQQIEWLNPEHVTDPSIHV